MDRHDLDHEKAENADYKDVTMHDEDVAASEALAHYSDAEKRKAFHKLDWNLIPL